MLLSVYAAMLHLVYFMTIVLLLLVIVMLSIVGVPEQLLVPQ